MAFVLRDRVKDTSTTTGTGDITVSGTAPTGFQTFDDVMESGDTTFYVIVNEGEGEWEVGVGTYSGSNVLARTTVRASSNSGSAVNFSAGTKDVFMDAHAALFSKVVTPYQFGGVGDGTADDADALNAAFDAIRDQITSDAKQLSRYVLDLSGGIWRTTESIDATGIIGWNLQIRGGIIVGECTGKAVLDLCGSRGYEMHGVSIYGDKTNMPSCAWQAARTSAVAFCDNASFIDCATAGYFSRAAIHDYGQETCCHVHGTYFNYNYDAYVAIFEGYSANPFTSDYQTVGTGASSHTNNKLINCDFRYLPIDGVAVTNITQAENAVITAANHPFAVGDKIVLLNIFTGMTDIQHDVGTVTDVTDDTITTDIDSSGYDAYTSGGIVALAQTKGTIYCSRLFGMNFDACYAVSYGKPQITLDFPDPNMLRMLQVDLDFLFDGTGVPQHIFINPRGEDVTIQGLRLKIYRSEPTACTLTIGGTGGSVKLYRPFIESVDPRNAKPFVNASSNSRLYCYGASILWPTATGTNIVDWENFAAFNGEITDVATGTTTTVGLIAPGVHAATSKTTPADNDEIPLVDSAASNVLKKLTWTNLKATLKTYFDSASQTLTNKDLTDSSNKTFETYGIALSDETTAITTGTNKATMSLPFAFTVTGVYATLNTASTSGAVTVDINEAGTTILSTKLTIDQSEKTSATAATAAVISDSSIAANAEIGFDIDGAGTGAKGLKVFITGHRT